MKKYSISTAVVTSLLLIVSCQKETQETIAPAIPVNDETALEQKPKTSISNIQELYDAVNNPGNAGKQLVLAPGTYVLDASYPNGGRLELQTDMSLRGHPGHPDWVIIDQSALPNSSYRLTPTVSTGGIRVGKGHNSFEWLTLKGGALAANPFSVIETDLIAAQNLVELSHVIVDCNGSRIGLMLRNRLDEHANRTVNAKLKDAEIKSAVNTNGFGIAIQNRISGSGVNLAMKGNYIHGNKIALLIFNSGLGSSIENCTVNVFSHSDRIEGNGCGIDPSSSNGSATTTVSNNTISIEVHGGSIKDNNPAGHPELTPTNGALPGAVYAAAAYNSLNNIGAFNKVSNNNLAMTFFGCDISNNNGTDIYAYGAWSQPLAILAGTNNHTKLCLKGTSATATVEAAASIPFEPAGTNTVEVIRD